ncbi:DUF1800 domain-containing protein [Ruficoccus sp. ZRK36]|uniref:DUF1800 domain-containing protein n=1 Tax=Ruficoccus sp. ZRK36 TaxID=2866311 RepID=UPI001C73D035|nr:DUF1800 domain-containing protein [Ruficoccus sp. ZRK36]QYY34456.1 DUF1800 domain-containing protein [Ruficoccus sp. ZRK36]
MTTSIKNLTPRQAWQTIPTDQWGTQEIQHLLRRAGFASNPEQVKEVRARGLEATLKKWFSKATPMTEPQETLMASEGMVQMRSMIRETEDPKEKNELRRKQREMNINSYRDYGIRWLQFARQPEYSPQEKYVMFLQDIFVVGRQAVQETGQLYDHQALLREQGLGSYPELAKQVSRSPAMIKYLNLNRNTKRAPNENFARELFELFTLGEGNYTEKDIKEAARAFTGYRYGDEGFKFIPNQHDNGEKTVFGQTGNFGGDEVIDIVYQQEAAQTFVPRELIAFYLTEDPLPESYVSELGQLWKAHGFDMSYLLITFFSSRAFYAPEFRGNLIKSPVQYYLGMCQDMDLDVVPLASRTLGFLRSMGQEFYNPPNVRGWVGGRHWINATTLEARRQLTRSLFWGINEEKLNADQVQDIKAARAEGYTRFSISGKEMVAMYQKGAPTVVNELCLQLFSKPLNNDFQKRLEDYLAKAENGKYHSTRDVILTLLQCPQYHLC